LVKPLLRLADRLLLVMNRSQVFASFERTNMIMALPSRRRTVVINASQLWTSGAVIRAQDMYFFMV